MLSLINLLVLATPLFVSSNAAATIPADDTEIIGIVNAGDPSAVLSYLETVTATTDAPIIASEASAVLSGIITAVATPTNLADYAEILVDLVEAGLTTDNVEQAVDFVEGLLDGENSDHNVNPRNPTPRAYPRAGPKDAPYDLTEQQLREAIYIPPTFQYGKGPQPIILVPGTGDTGYTTFVGNYIPLLQGSKIADPVWLNIPDFLLDDAQVNSEYVAYAINYIYGISCQKKVAVLSWSQGGLDAQWAFKYWPSTRSRVTDFVAISPDFHGTVQANLIDVGEALPPSILQQEYNSNFVTTLRMNGGDSAYVPTTTVYSGFFDEIVEPQQGTNASAYLLDARNVGVTNNEVQIVCGGKGPAGTFYTHEGVLYNPLGFALLVDALSHSGPGNPSRLNLDQVCSTYLTPGLDLTDFLLTENSILIAGIAILTYPDPVFNEPPIKPYARRGASSTTTAQVTPTPTTTTTTHAAPTSTPHGKSGHSF